jgi:hypothetical protein
VNSFQLPVTSGKYVIMTYYHGPLNPPFVFTGFAIWDYVRADCQTLVDFVLQDIWGLSRTVPQTRAAAVSAAAPRLAPPAHAGVRPSPPSGVARPASPGASRSPSRE